MMLMYALHAASEGLLDAVAAVPQASLFAFAAHRLVAGLTPDVREALGVATILGDASH
jgi:hypothetical protein